MLTNGCDDRDEIRALFSSGVDLQLGESPPDSPEMRRNSRERMNTRSEPWSGLCWA